MAQNPKSQNDVRSLQQWYPKYLEHIFNVIRYIPEVHSGTSCLVNYIQYIWQIIRKWVKTQPLRCLSKVNMGTLPSQVHRTHCQCYWTEFVTARYWSHVATNHKLRRQGFLICRNLWLSQFVTVQNTTSQIDVNSARGYSPNYRKHVHIDIGPFQESFLGTSFMGIITDGYT